MGLMKDLDRRIRQGGDDAIAAVSELLPRWTIVEERLPERGESVLLWFGTERYAEVGEFDQLTNGTAWFVTRDDGAARPTHWMPLPEPPEVK